MKETKLLNEYDVDITGVSVRTLQRWRSKRIGIPFIKIGHAVRYKNDDVEKYIAMNRHDSPPAATELISR